MQIQPMISTHPDVRGSVNDSLVRAIEAAYGCAAVCHICAEECRRCENACREAASSITPSRH